MKRNLAPILALAGLTVAYAALVLGTATALPERVAVHFGWHGRADGWADRLQATVAFETLMVVPAIFLLLAFLMQIMPAGAFNLPHRDYWLAPERRAQTVAVCARQVIWMGCLMDLFLAGIYALTIEANRLTPPRLPAGLFLLLLLGFLTATGVWTWRFLRRFYHPPTGRSC